MSKNYYDLEQLESRLLAGKSEISQINRKILVELVVATWFLIYLLSIAEVITPLPLVVNFVAWLLWLALATRRLVYRPIDEFPSSSDRVSDEYREIQFYLHVLRRRETISDLLTGAQFLLGVAPLVFSRRLWWF